MTPLLTEAIRRSSKEKRSQLSIRLRTDHHRQLEELAKTNNVSLNELIGRLIEVALEPPGPSTFFDQLFRLAPKEKTNG